MNRYSERIREPTRHNRQGPDPMDAVGVYLQEIRSRKRLSRNEEIELVSVYQEGVLAQSRRQRGSAAASRLATIKRGKEAGQQLIESHLPLVFAIAKRFHSSNRNHVDIGDLIGAGHEGLLTALKRFDGSLGYRFSTYAAWWVANKMSLEIRDATWLMHIPQRVHRDVIRLRRTLSTLPMELGRSPSLDEIARAVGWPVEKVELASPLDRAGRLIVRHRCWSRRRNNFG